MRTQVIPYLNFNGHCREALTFYQQCLGGDLSLQRVAESPMAAKMPSESAANILHGCLSRNGETLVMGSDMLGQNTRPGNSIFLCLNCSSDEEIHAFFEKLSAEGTVKTPLHQGFLGATSGELIDKYGMSWMLTHTRN